MSEAGGAAQIARDRHNEVVKPYMEEQQCRLQSLVQRGLIRRSALTEDFSMVLAPFVVASMSLMLPDEASARQKLARIRELHRRLLNEMLS